MIRSIGLSNFKGIGGGESELQLGLKPISLLFGANSSGKSTIIQAIHYLREILERRNLDPDTTLLGGEAINLGGFRSLIHQNDLKRKMRLRVELDLQDAVWPDYGMNDPILVEKERVYEDYFSDEDGYNPLRLQLESEVQSSSIELTVEWSELLSRPQITGYRVGINGAELVSIESTIDGKNVFLNSFNWNNPLFIKHFKQALDESRGDDEEFTESPIYNFMKTFNVWDPDGSVNASFEWQVPAQESALPHLGRVLELEEGTRTRLLEQADETLNSAVLMEHMRLLTQLVVGPAEILRNFLRNMCYIGPLRKVPDRHRSRARSQVESNWANGLAAWDFLIEKGESFVEQVSDWLSGESRLGTGYSLRLKRYRELDDERFGQRLLRDEENIDLIEELKKELRRLPIKDKISVIEEQSGIELDAYDIGVGISQLVPVVVAALNQKAAFLAIEQPELHVHPRIQVGLGDLFAAAIKQSPDPRMFLIETHSEHMMLRLLRRIRETADDELPQGHPSLTPDDVAVLVFDQTDEGIKVRNIGIDATGEFTERWPKGFFQERAEELF